MSAPVFYTDPKFWIYIAVLVPYALCLGFYGLRSPWWASPVGKAMLALYASLVSVLTLVLLALLGVVPEEVRAPLRIVLLGGVAVSGWVQLYSILYYQRQDRRERRGSCRALLEQPMRRTRRR